jgi:hypothetical protein
MPYTLSVCFGIPSLTNIPSQCFLHKNCTQPTNRTAAIALTHPWGYNCRIILRQLSHIKDMIESLQPGLTVEILHETPQYLVNKIPMITASWVDYWRTEHNVIQYSITSEKIQAQLSHPICVLTSQPIKLVLTREEVNIPRTFLPDWYRTNPLAFKTLQNSSWLIMTWIPNKCKDNPINLGIVQNCMGIHTHTARELIHK